MLAKTILRCTLFYSLCGLALPLPRSRAQAPTEVPTFKITPTKSTIKFAVKASVPIEGTFDKWDATFTVTSTPAQSGVLDVKIQLNTLSKIKRAG